MAKFPKGIFLFFIAWGSKNVCRKPIITEEFIVRNLKPHKEMNHKRESADTFKDTPTFLEVYLVEPYGL